MKQVEITRDMLREIEAHVPTTNTEALDPEWLSVALSHLAGGRKVATVELADVNQAVAAKVRVGVIFEGLPDQVYKLCIKGFLGPGFDSPEAHVTTMRESDFYAQIAPRISMRTPPCAALVTDRAAKKCILIMADMIAAGVHFHDALEPLSLAQVEDSLDQLARLHAHPELLEGRDWIPYRLDEILASDYLTWDQIQALMHDERRGDLPDRTLDATLLQKGMEILARSHRDLPHTVCHGDTHPGNVYRTAEGKMGFTDWQLVTRGHWSADVAYHINSVLPVELAEKAERDLLKLYLDARQRHGGEAPNEELAWEQYRQAPVYGYYHWAITQRVKRPLTNETFRRLGAAVTRHESYKLLGL